jgi:hypothetical protein
MAACWILKDVQKRESIREVIRRLFSLLFLARLTSSATLAGWGLLSESYIYSLLSFSPQVSQQNELFRVIRSMTQIH